MLVPTTDARVAQQRRFYLGMAIAAAAVVFTGFAPTYYLRSVVQVARFPTGVPVSSSLPGLSMSTRS